MLRYTMRDLESWLWDSLREEFESHLPLRWLIQHIAANPRDIALSFAPFTNEALDRKKCAREERKAKAKESKQKGLNPSRR